MNKIHQFMAAGLVLAATLAFLPACSSVTNQDVPETSSQQAPDIALLKEFEQYLNEGEVAKALELFADGAELIEVQPTYLVSYNGTGTFYTRQLARGEQVSYSGKSWIKTYLYTMTNYKFHSSDSYFSTEGNEAVWRCQVKIYDAQLQIEVKATMEDQKFKSVTVTNLALAPL